MRDMITKLKPVVGFAYAAAQTATASGAWVDLLGVNGVAFFITVGASGDTLSSTVRFDLSLEWADADAAGAVDSATIAAVPAAKQFGDTTINAISKIYEVGANADLKRFVRVKLTAVGTHSSGSAIHATAILGRLGTEGKAW
jgi:hypothetical protein